MSYKGLFSDYAARTDGKFKIASEIFDLYPDISSMSVLDIGAGGGEIAKYLAERAERIVCIEQNGEFLDRIKENIRANKNSEIVLSTVEEWKSNETFDVVLLSYVLDMYEDIGKFERLVTSAFSHSKDGRRVLAASYLEGGEWDVFTQHVAQHLRFQRTGGFARQVHKLRKIGFYIIIRKIFDTKVYDHSLEGLYSTLSFFAKDRIDQYNAHKDKLLPILENHSTREGKYVVTRIKEVIFEIIQF
jgi:SAM-dependent methyltransferase